MRTIGNIVCEYGAANRLYGEARFAENEILIKVWMERRLELEAELAEHDVIVKHEKEEAA